MEPSSSHLGQIGPEAHMPAAFIGHVFVPEGVDRADYINHCYHQFTVSVITTRGELYNRVAISADNLQRLKFPTGATNVGSPVVCVTIPVHNQPVIVTVLKFIDDAPVVTAEDTLCQVLLTTDTSYSFTADGVAGSFSLSTLGDSTSSVKLMSAAGTAELDVHVQGLIQLEADVAMHLLTQEGFTISIGPHDSQKLFTLLADQGLTYSDDNQNSLVLNEEGLNYRFNGKSEKALLGESTKDWLNSLGDLLCSLTVSTVFGPSGTPLNVIQIKQHLAKLDNLLSNKFSHP